MTGTQILNELDDLRAYAERLEVRYREYDRKEVLGLIEDCLTHESGRIWEV